MWPSRYFSPKYWAKVFWGSIAPTSNNGAVSAYRYELCSTNGTERIENKQRCELFNDYDANDMLAISQRHELENTNKRAQ